MDHLVEIYSLRRGRLWRSSKGKSNSFFNKMCRSPDSFFVSIDRTSSKQTAQIILYFVLYFFSRLTHPAKRLRTWDSQSFMWCFCIYDLPRSIHLIFLVSSLRFAMIFLANQYATLIRRLCPPILIPSGDLTPIGIRHTSANDTLTLPHCHCMCKPNQASVCGVFCMALIMG